MITRLEMPARRCRASSLVLALVALAGFASARLFPEVWNTGLFLPYWPQFWFGAVVCGMLQHGRNPGAICGRRVKPIAIGAIALLIWSVRTMPNGTSSATAGQRQLQNSGGYNEAQVAEYQAGRLFAGAHG